MKKIVYYCPTDKKQVLRVEPAEVMKMMIAERPMTCPKCKKDYYSWQCSTKTIEED